ncbi:MAG: hypothetical protein ABSE46_23515 [Terracidiphilus sp.]|jgi:hypothetical protein
MQHLFRLEGVHGFSNRSLSMVDDPFVYRYFRRHPLNSWMKAFHPGVESGFTGQEYLARVPTFRRNPRLVDTRQHNNPMTARFQLRREPIWIELSRNKNTLFALPLTISPFGLQIAKTQIARSLRPSTIQVLYQPLPEAIE